MSLFESTFRWIGAAIFTVLVPGTVTAFLPYYILDPSVPEIGAWGPLQLIASTVLVVGASIYFRCLWDFVVAGHGLPAPVDHPKKLVVSGLFSFYYKTFARLALLPYIGGTVIHIVRLTGVGECVSVYGAVSDLVLASFSHHSERRCKQSIKI